MPTTIEPGIYPDEMTDAEHRQLEYPSPSTLAEFVTGKKATGRALVVGSAFHDAILRPDYAKRKYVTIDTEHDLRTVEGRTAMADAELAHNGKTVLRPSEKQLVVALYKGLGSSEIGRKFHKAEGDVEIVMVGDLEAADGTKIRCKGRIDKETAKALWDLKSTGHDNEKAFLDSMFKFRYHAQAAMYSDLAVAAGGERKPFGFLCVSKRSFDVWATRLTPEQEAAGRRHYQDMLALWARYREG